MINACWVLDDKNKDAKEARKLAAKLFEKANIYPDGYVIIVDLYRRAEEFEKAKAWLIEANKNIFNRTLKNILSLEEKLIDSQDSKCHNLEECEEDEEIDFNDDLEEDSYDEIGRKLFNEDSKEPIILTYDGKPTEFGQIGVFPVTIDGEERVFAMLSCPKIEEGTGFVFEVIGDGKIEGFYYVSDKEINEKVFEEYYKLLKKKKKK